MNLQPWIKNTKHYFIVTEGVDLLFNKDIEQKCATQQKINRNSKAC